MEEVLIHIGYHKTGTSWLQTQLFVQESDVFAPLSTKKIGASTLAKDFIKDEEGYLLDSFQNNELVILKNLNLLLKSKNLESGKIPVLSHERLSGNPYSGCFDASVICRRLHHTFPGAKILLGIREQSSLILSTYFQYLVAGGNHSLRKFLTTQYDESRPCFSPGHFEFHHLIKTYQAQFSKKNVLVMPYELFASDKMKFLKTLGDFLGKNISSSHLDFNELVNPQSNQWIKYKLRGLNPFTQSNSLNNYSSLNRTIPRRVINKVKKVLSSKISQQKNDQQKEKLHAIVKDWMKTRYCKSNDITEQLIEQDLGQYGYQTTRLSQIRKG